MKPQGRLGDKANCLQDSHGCKGCSHNVTGPAVIASTNVFTNSKPALRVDDVGIHAACCGQNTWTAAAGSATVFFNGKPAFRMGDMAEHCGGVGQLIEGSNNVFVGDSTSVGAAISSKESTCGICSLKKEAISPPAQEIPSTYEESPSNTEANENPEPEENKPAPEESPILREQNKKIEEQREQMATESASEETNNEEPEELIASANTESLVDASKNGTPYCKECEAAKI